MKRVLIFFNNEPVTAVSVMRGVTRIHRKYPNGENARLEILSVGLSSFTGDNGMTYFATDRELTSEEILEASKKFDRHQ